ncbi:hypothetical protein [Aquimarina sediminis]|uniref:hypothetical protein n=1 Tax=Aquimarina sediminis TaxID=2070536 RepID=UPI0013E8BB44|nr:hypothetical protein [Aquimarina sediminis]
MLEALSEETQLILMVIAIAILFVFVSLNTKKNKNKLYNRDERNYRKNYFKKKKKKHS